jgi:hypothetical protein
MTTTDFAEMIVDELGLPEETDCFWETRDDGAGGVLTATIMLGYRDRIVELRFIEDQIEAEIIENGALKSSKLLFVSDPSFVGQLTSMVSKFRRKGAR